MSKLHPLDTAAKSEAPSQTHERSLSPSREDLAREEIGQTEITGSQARIISVVFLAIICWIPFTQHRMGFREYQRTRDVGEPLSFYSVFDGVFEKMATAWSAGATPTKRFLGANAVLLKNIHEFEEKLDDVSWVTQLTQPPVQDLLCRLGVGNEKALVGSEGWLFFEPGVRSLTGPAFLDPDQLRKRARSGDETKGFVQPDPVKAITHFRDQLSEQGIDLVVMPVPIKPSIYPEQLSSRYAAATGPLQNESFARCLEQLKVAGVSVYDPSASLYAFKETALAYLKTDTHWTPPAMAHVASGLAAYLGQRVTWAPCLSAPVLGPRQTITSLGDIATMLKLPSNQVVFASETVAVQAVEPAAAASAAEVLLLGDSFANIYSSELMGWGRDGGFTETLSLQLKRPVQAIVRNDGGAHVTRQELSTALRKGDDVLSGIKVVVWMFAARELAIGDWPLIDLEYVPQNAHAVATNTVAGITRGTVAAVSGRPKAGALYKNFIFKMYLSDLVDAEGAPVGQGQGVVCVFGMRDSKILPIASAQTGDAVALRLRPWEDVKSKYDAIKAGELDDIMLEIEHPVFWGEPVD